MTVVSMAGVGMLPSADVGQQLLVLIRCLPLFVLALQPPRGLGTLAIILRDYKYHSALLLASCPPLATSACHPLPYGALSPAK